MSTDTTPEDYGIPPLPEWKPPAGFVPEPPPATATRTWCPVCGLPDQRDGHTLRMKRCPGVVQVIRYQIVDQSGSGVVG